MAKTEQDPKNKIALFPTRVEEDAQEARLARAQKLIDEVTREKAEKRASRANRKPFGKR